MTHETRTCPDCDGSMTEVRIIDKAHSNLQSRLEYTLLDSKVSFWTAARPIAGTVQTLRCDACGLLKLYGVPKVVD